MHSINSMYEYSVYSMYSVYSVYSVYSMYSVYSVYSMYSIHNITSLLRDHISVPIKPTNSFTDNRHNRTTNFGTVSSAIHGLCGHRQWQCAACSTVGTCLQFQVADRQ